MAKGDLSGSSSSRDRMVRYAKLEGLGVFRRGALDQ